MPVLLFCGKKTTILRSYTILTELYLFHHNPDPQCFNVNLAENLKDETSDVF
jgi:hypothetical protein